jgi:uncharacterized protein
LKIIKSKQTIFELIQQYPELKEILYEMGFKLLSNPVMLQTMGKIMTLKKGCEMRGINIEEVKRLLKEKDFLYEEEIS